MKTRNILFVLAAGLLLLCSCNLDKFPPDQVTSGDMQNEESAAIATNGNYALFKFYLSYNGFYTVGNTFLRHFLLMSELKSDNILMSGKSTDPLFLNATLSDMASDTDIEYFWFISYKICYATSAMINAISDDSDAVLRHIKGENYFMRAFTHMALCQIYAFPYALKGADEIGVILRTGPAASNEVKRRASVGEVYEQCESDLKRAIELMDGGTRRGDKGYIDVNSARALLCRLYLYQQRWDESIALADELLGSDPSSHLESDLEHLFQNTRTSDEVLWCIALGYNETEYPGAQAMVGSMYYSQGDPGNGTGWAEIYYSQPLLDLLGRYPEDKRLTQIRVERNASTTGAKMIYWPVLNTQDGFAENWIDRAPVYDGSKWTCKDSTGVVHTVESELVNGYPKTYIMLDGEKQYVTVADSMGCRTGTGGDMYPLNYQKKFSNQDGIPSNMASPAMLRYAEVVLNRAEAKAHKGDVSGALADVNVIRKRAGLSDEAMFTASNMAERGYDDVLDVVLDERRMELCFEGFRTLDLQRNGKVIDRRYAGRQPYEVVQPDDLRLRYFIPVTEITSTGIEQNNR